jgi:poly(hydroxyalkanoate) depolymerase family esterase
MDEDRMTTMAEATRLTREGRLSEAMTLIQRTVGSPAPSSTATGARSPSRPAGRSLGSLGKGLPALAIHGRKKVHVVPPGAQFLSLQHTGAAGSRPYKLYVPSGYGAGQDVPLVVMLHGGTQDAHDFAAGTRMNELAERDLFLVAYPEQPSSANSMKYWNWFQPGHQVTGTGEPSLIAGITREIMHGYSVDAGRVYVAGFSAGGAMAAVMAATYPDLYAAVGVHSGLASGAAHDIPSAFAAMTNGPMAPTGRPMGGIPLIVFHGDQDQIVGHVNADSLVGDGLRALGAGAVRSVEEGRVPDGRAYTRAIYRNAEGEALIEQWRIHEGGHAWSGGSALGSYTDSRGPDASGELLRFFREHPRQVLGSYQAGSGGQQAENQGCAAGSTTGGPAGSSGFAGAEAFGNFALGE